MLEDAPKRGPLFPAGIGDAHKNFAANAVRVMRDLEGRDPEFRPFRVHDLRHADPVAAQRRRHLCRRPFPGADVSEIDFGRLRGLVPEVD